jgi:hypothetical protein
MSTPHRKRKRAASDAVINPLSHTPDTLRQFALAGYPAEKPLPSKAYPGFPHRPARSKKGQSHKQRGGQIVPDEDDAEGDDADDLATSAEAASDADVETNGEDTASGWQTTDFETTDVDTDHSGSSRRLGSGGRSKRGQKKGKEIDRRAHAYRARVGCLTAVIRRCLAEGDIVTAKRAFGLLARARVYGKKVDLRWERYWEMGAEVLMREGETAASQKDRDGERGGNGDGGGAVKWNGEGEGDDGQKEEQRLNRLKAYYGYLIQQYPYSKQHAASANSVLDFQVALFSAEMEAAYAAHKRGLERLQRDGGWEEDAGDDMDVEEPFDYDLNGDRGVMGEIDRQIASAQEHLRGLKEDQLRLEALQRMIDIAQRMDTVMEMVPFSRDHELLRLRAMVALYIGDLYVPPPPRSSSEDRDTRRARAGQRAKAKGLLRRIKEGGGELKDHDKALLESLVSDDEEDDEEEGTSVLPMFSSLEV